MRNSAIVAAVLLLTASTAAQARTAAPGRQAGRCSALAGRVLAPNVTITEAREMPAAAAKGGTEDGRAVLTPALPAYCAVRGVIDPRVGAGGKTYGIRFALALP